MKTFLDAEELFKLMDALTLEIKDLEEELRRIKQILGVLIVPVPQGLLVFENARIRFNQYANPEQGKPLLECSLAIRIAARSCLKDLVALAQSKIDMAVKSLKTDAILREKE